jgi:6-phosphogluconolactonase
MMIDDRLTRRALLGAATLAALPGAVLAAPAATRALYAGGYNKEGGAGLLPLDYAPAAGAWHARTPVAVAPDASWGVRHPRLGLHYLVQEGSAGKVAVLRQRGSRWSTPAARIRATSR